MTKEKFKTIKELEVLNRGNGNYFAQIHVLKGVLGLIDEEILYYEKQLRNLEGYMPMIHAHKISQVKGRLEMLKELKARIIG